MVGALLTKVAADTAGAGLAQRDAYPAMVLGAYGAAFHEHAALLLAWLLETAAPLFSPFEVEGALGAALSVLSATTRVVVALDTADTVPGLHD